MSKDREPFSLADLEIFVAVFRGGSKVPVTEHHDLLIQQLADVLGKVLADAENADWQSGSRWKSIKHDSYVGELLVDALGLRTAKPKSGHSSLAVRSVDAIEEALSARPNLQAAIDYVFRLNAGEREEDILMDLSDKNGKSPESNKRTIARYRIAANRYVEFWGKLNE